MVAAIPAIGPEHFMLSSVAGIPLLPQTVEAYRRLAAMFRAYGMTEVERRQLMTGSAKELLTLSRASLAPSLFQLGNSAPPLATTESVYRTPRVRVPSPWVDLPALGR